MTIIRSSEPTLPSSVAIRKLTFIMTTKLLVFKATIGRGDLNRAVKMLQCSLFLPSCSHSFWIITFQYYKLLIFRVPKKMILMIIIFLPVLSFLLQMRVFWEIIIHYCPRTSFFFNVLLSCFQRWQFQIFSNKNISFPPLLSADIFYW